MAWAYDLAIANGGPAQADLSWSAIAGVTSYDIERDGVLIATGVTALTYSDTGLTPGTTYKYRVRAIEGTATPLTYDWRDDSLLVDYWTVEDAVASTSLASRNAVLANIPVDIVDSDGFTLTADQALGITQADGGVFGVVACVGIGPGIATDGMSKVGGGGWQVGFRWDWANPPTYGFCAFSGTAAVALSDRDPARNLLQGGVGVYATGKVSNNASLYVKPDRSGPGVYTTSGFNTSASQGMLPGQTVNIESFNGQNLRWVAMGVISGQPTQEFVDGLWAEYGVNVSMTGGTVSAPGDGYVYHTFTTSGTLTPIAVPVEAEWLTVAGGGGGGTNHGGGGGAGGLLTGTATLSSAQTVTIGAGGVFAATKSATGTSGSDSSLGYISTLGGGGGGSRTDAAEGGAEDGLLGGSGGGGGGNDTTTNTAGLGTAGQGNAGGDGIGGGGSSTGGGGGGAGGAGTAGVGGTAGPGGTGLDVWGSTYSTGGHGGPTSAVTKTANTGDGGDGGGAGSGLGTTGGSGIVAVRYPVDYAWTPSTFDPESDVTWHSLFWAEGTAFVAQGYSDTNSVTTWPNETAESDATATTAPTYLAADSNLNGQPSVNVNNANINLATSAFSTPPSYASGVTIVTVAYAADLSGNNFLHDGIGTSNRAAYYDSGAAYSRLYAGNNLTTTDIPTVGRHLYAAYLDATITGGRLLTDNILKAGPGNAGTHTLTGLRIGNQQAGSAPWSGSIALIGVFEGDFTQHANYSPFLSWVAEHYGIMVVT